MTSRRSRQFPPPPPLPQKVRLFQRVPPAIFPPVLGLLGLGLTWRAGHGMFGISKNVAELFLGGVSLVFVFSAISYLAKLMHRPGVVLEDASTLPGRTGLAAFAMGAMLIAAALLPYAPGPAAILLYTGFACHAGLMGFVLTQLVRSPATLQPITPAFYLVFAGVAVFPFAAIPLGDDLLVNAILLFSTGATAVVAGLTLPGLFLRSTSAPLRPLHAIHLAPAGLVASGAALSGLDWLAFAMLTWCNVLFLILVWRLRWMMEAGFSGFWGAFTFPIAAFAGAWITRYLVSGAEPARTIGGLALVLATLVIPPIAYRILRLWADGSLAAKTNAAIA